MEQVISADDHMDLAYVPPRLWQERVPAEYREHAPKVVQQAAGPMWVKEGQSWAIWGSKRADNRKVVFDLAGLPEEPEPGVFRPASPRYRLEDMDRDGVHAQVIYNFLDWPFADPALKAECMKAYNSWLAEDFCAADRDRLIGLAVLPSHDPVTAVAELDRIHRLGLRGAIFDVFGAARPVFDRVWDPLWAAAAETGVALSVHIGGGCHTLGERTARTNGTWLQAARTAINGVQLDEILSALIMSGVTDRHPTLKLVLGESGLGWAPYVLERLDYELQNYGHLGDLPKALTATEYFRRQIYLTFQDERLGVRLIPEIGEDNVMWASDYPHADGTFPHSREAVARIFAGVEPRVLRKATRDNAQRLYGIVAFAEGDEGLPRSSPAARGRG
jgi:predicted TIM-barrel fold metal-dependent hydrolase